MKQRRKYLPILGGVLLLGVSVAFFVLLKPQRVDKMTFTNLSSDPFFGFCFDFRSMGLPNGSLERIEYDRKKKVVRITEPAKKTKQIPFDRDRWRWFLACAKKLGIESWKEDYHNPDVYDGHLWGLMICFDGNVVFSMGQNDYPGRALDSESSLVWDEFYLRLLEVVNQPKAAETRKRRGFRPYQCQDFEKIRGPWNVRH